MRIDLNQYRECTAEYTAKAPPYENGLIFVQSGAEKKDVDSLLMKLRRLCKDNEGLSFRLITSTHESTGYIEKVTVKTGKPGRPKTIVKGKKAVNHCHGVIINESTGTDIYAVKKDLQVYFRKRRQKRSNLKTQKIKDAWQNNLSIIKYMDRQADSTHSYGSFDFDYFLSPYYMPPEPDNFDNILDFEK